MENIRHKIVLVDDNLTILTLGKSMLQSLYKVYTVDSAASLFFLLEKEMPDLILLDVEMPEMNGFETLIKLKADARYLDIPVVFLTSRIDEESERMGFSLGAADYLTKPFTGPLLQRRVSNLLIHKNVQDKMRRAEVAEESNKAKSRFLANISHEIRTPMNVIVGLTQLLLEEDSLPDHVIDSLKKIDTAGVTLMGLVNDVLDFSKIESGKLSVTPAQYDVAGILSEIIDINAIRIEDKPIIFQLSIDSGMPAVLYGDDLRVKQILNNLLSNAFKYTHAGTVTLSMHCVRQEAGDAEIYINVSDTGIGMRQEDLPKLYEVYSQLDTQANREIEGTGLGLFITKTLTELMGGEIKVESEYGVGTTFKLRILQGYVNDEVIGDEIAAELQSFRYKKKKPTENIIRPDLSYAKVLVVDDFVTNLDVAKGMLGKYKIMVDCVASGYEAVERLRLGHPLYDAIFMDHMMPGLDGIEAVKLIRAISTQYAKMVPIIALTANAVAGNERMFLDSGFNAFLSKPVSVIKIDAAVRQWIMRGEGGGVASACACMPGSDEEDGQGAKLSASPPEILGINSALGMSYYDDDISMFTDILMSFVENIPAETEKLYKVSADTLRDYAINAHTVKGSAASIGAEGLSERANNMVIMARAGDIAGVLAGNDEFIKEIEGLTAGIEAYLKTPH